MRSLLTYSSYVFPLNKSGSPRGSSQSLIQLFPIPISRICREWAETVTLGQRFELLEILEFTQSGSRRIRRKYLRLVHTSRIIQSLMNRLVSACIHWGTCTPQKLPCLQRRWLMELDVLCPYLILQLYNQLWLFRCDIFENGSQR